MSDLNVPERWSDRLVSLMGARRDLWVVMGVLGCTLLLALFLRLRPPPPQVAPPSSASSPAGSAPAPEVPDVFVHVSGAVRHPGLYDLSNGSRVADALEAAGGPTKRADVGAINLAEVLADGVKIEVPRKGSSNSGISAPVTGATTVPTIVNVNTADAVALETIPKIGPVLAEAILRYRQEKGLFPSVDALLDVSGIGPATLEAIRPYVTT